MVQRIIKNDDDLALLHVYLDQRKRPFTVDVVEGRNRSDEQNKLAFKWYGEISDQTGEDKEDVRARCKLECGVPLLRRDKPKFKEVYNRTLLHLTYEEKVAFIRYTEMQVTSLLNVGQMSEYLDALFKRQASFGIALTVPEDKFAYAPKERAAA